MDDVELTINYKDKDAGVRTFGLLCADYVGFIHAEIKDIKDDFIQLAIEFHHIITTKFVMEDYGINKTANIDLNVTALMELEKNGDVYEFSRVNDVEFDALHIEFLKYVSSADDLTIKDINDFIHTDSKVKLVKKKLKDAYAEIRLVELTE